MAWTFGTVLLEGRSHTVDPVTRRTQFESGPDRIKRISTDETNRVTGSVYLADATAEQAFWAHWEGDANRGADWFTMPLQTLGVTATHTVRISNPRLSPRGRGQIATFQIETRQRLSS